MPNPIQLIEDYAKLLMVGEVAHDYKQTISMLIGCAIGL